MTFPNQIPLSHAEKWYIAQFVELSHKDMARSLNALFNGTNHGTRSRHTVYLFRQTDEYAALRKKAELKEEQYRYYKCNTVL